MITAVDDAETPRRFSATRFAAQRAELGLSGAFYGTLVGMSGATIYLWESRAPTNSSFSAWSQFALGKRTALEKVNK